MGANPSREKAIREDSTKEKIVPGSPTVEGSITENPSGEFHNGEDHAKLTHDEDHVTGTVQKLDGMR